MKIFKTTLLLAVFAASLQTAHAQQNPSDGSDGAVLTLPPEVTNVISIDAHNHAIIETQETPGDAKEYSLSVPRHIYSGALARVFGGDIVPTETLVLPESALRGFGNSGGTNRLGSGNQGNQNFGDFSNFNNTNNSFNRSFSRYAPIVRVNNLKQFNRVLGFLDRPIRQAEVGVDGVGN